jgi:acetyl esterase/lipase
VYAPWTGNWPALVTEITTALAVCFLSLWTFVPAPTAALLVLSVGTTEYCAWLVVSAAAIGGLALSQARRSRAARLAAGLALTACVLAARPLLQIPPTIRGFDAELRRALGADALSHLPPEVVGAMRPRPLGLVELFTGLAVQPIRVTRDVLVASPGGARLTATIYRPDDGRILPTVVQIYGGGWRNGRPDDDPQPAMAIAAAGYVVVAIDYRHAPAWRWPAQIDDVRSALRWIGLHGLSYGADPSRMALIGRSAGAQLALIAALEPGAPPVTGVVAYYSPVDLTEGWRHPPPLDPLDVRAVEENLIGGTPDERPLAYADASPITYASRPHPPVLLISAGRDHIVEPHFSERLQGALADTGVSALLVIPWADHAFDAVPFRPSSQVAIYYTQRFLAWTFARMSRPG